MPLYSPSLCCGCGKQLGVSAIETNYRGDDAMNFRSWLHGTVILVFLGVSCWAQAPDSNQKLAQQAQKEYAAGKFADAERGFAELTRRDPSNIVAQIYLGQALFRQEKYPASVAPYEKARELEKNGSKLSLDQHRILVDQLAMAYGISGNLKKARALLEDAIHQDPEYPLNYYNLACTYADEGDKEKVLANLSLSFQHKDHVLKGEHMPDPRSDSSFQKYVRDEDFIKLMKKLGYD
jgi:tetratricopeptide (TPR) repeat protein